MSTNKNILKTELISIEGVVDDNASDSPDIQHHINMQQEIALQDSIKQPFYIGSNELLSETEGKIYSDVKNNLQIRMDDNKSEYDGVKIKTAKKPQDETYNTVISIHNESEFQSYVFSGTISKLLICEFVEMGGRSKSFMSVLNALSREYGKYAMFFRICEEEQDGKSNWYQIYKKLDSGYVLRFYKNGKPLGCHAGIDEKSLREIVRKHLGIESQHRHNPQQPSKEKRKVDNEDTQSNSISVGANACTIFLAIICVIFYSIALAIDELSHGAVCVVVCNDVSCEWKQDGKCTDINDACDACEAIDNDGQVCDLLCAMPSRSGKEAWLAFNIIGLMLCLFGILGFSSNQINFRYSNVLRSKAFIVFLCSGLCAIIAVIAFVAANDFDGGCYCRYWYKTGPYNRTTLNLGRSNIFDIVIGIVLCLVACSAFRLKQI